MVGDGRVVLLNLASCVAAFTHILLLSEVWARTGCGFSWRNENPVLTCSSWGCLQGRRTTAVERALLFCPDGRFPLSKETQTGVGRTCFPPGAAGSDRLSLHPRRGDEARWEGGHALWLLLRLLLLRWEVWWEMGTSAFGKGQAFSEGFTGSYVNRERNGTRADAHTQGSRVFPLGLQRRCYAALSSLFTKSHVEKQRQKHAAACWSSTKRPF